MPKRVTRTVGDGITERSKSAVRFDLAVREDAKALGDALAGLNVRLDTMWGANATILDAALARLAEIKSGAPDIRTDIAGWNALFAERKTEGWYLHSISIEKDVAEGAMRKRRPNEAVQAALLIGEYLTELRFKELWEGPAIAGAATIEGANKGGRIRAAESANKHAKIKAYYLDCLARLEGDVARAKPATARQHNISRRHLNRILAK